MGTRRKPTHLKLLSATTRPSRAAPESPLAPITTAAELRPPTWMKDANALLEWKRLAPELIESRLLNTGSVATFALLCTVHARLVLAASSGAALSAALITQYRRLLRDLMEPRHVPPAPRPPNRFLTNFGLKPRR